MDRNIITVIIVGLVAFVGLYVSMSEPTGAVFRQIPYDGKMATEYDCMAGEFNGPAAIGYYCLVNDDCECGSYCAEGVCAVSRVPVEPKIYYHGYWQE